MIAGPLFTWIVSYSAHAQGTVLLTVKADRDEYVSMEPVRLTVTLRNESGRTIRIPDIEFLGINMEYMAFEIIGPDGKRARRHFSYEQRYGIVSPLYAGEPLLPGRSVTTFLYPNATRRVPPLPDGPRLEATFKETGTYLLRVVYGMPDFYKELWKPPGGELSSNEIKISVRAPTTEEREIIDAIWSEGGRGGFIGPMMGDQYRIWHDEVAIRAVIEKYPNNPMIRHAYLALAKSFCSDDDDKSRMEQAIPILEHMMKAQPSFRFEETRQHLGWAYAHADRSSDAFRVFQETLVVHPELTTNSRFMASALQATGKSYPQFKELRRKGELSENVRFEELQ